MGKTRGTFWKGVSMLVGRKKGRLRIWGCGCNDREKTELRT